jgi:DNA-binding transcriptional MerR regulator
MNELDKKFYKISEVAEILGVPASTLRFWEKEFTVIKPKRNDKNTRFYTPEDVETIRMVYFLVKEKGLKLDAAQAEIKHNRHNVSKQSEVIERLQGMKKQLQELQKAFNALR